ncbi:MAG: beta-ketoacyl-ACP synthase III [Bdellovibrionota bacterium]
MSYGQPARREADVESPLVNLRTRIIGTGSALPSRCVTNFDLAEHLDTSDEWIRERVGIQARYICGEGESTVSLAAEATRRALEMAQIAPSDIDLIVFGTFTPGQTLPSAAAMLASELGVSEVVAFDLQAACSGFLFGLVTAEALMTSLNCRTALVVGADTLSTVVNWSDRDTAVLFGDGAGVCILQRDNASSLPLIETSYLRTAGDGANFITCSEPRRVQESNPFSSAAMVPEEESSKENNFIHMKGRSVFKSGVQLMTTSVEKVLEQAKLGIDDVALFIPHQSNIRMMQNVAQNVGITDESRIATTIHTVGNTSAASIPMTLDHYSRSGHIAQNDRLLLTAVGSGMSYGSLLLRW